jgi:hypothetical protein
MMTTRIDSRWQALEPDPEKPVFQLLDAGHPLRLYIGREITGEFLFLLLDEEKPPTMKGLRSVSIRTFERGDGEWALLLTLTRPELFGMFSLLCEDLVASSRHLPKGSAGGRFLSVRLASWRLLLEEGRADLLTTSQVRGLFGELCVLDRYVLRKFGVMDGIRSWVGPLGADQDFQFAGQACEVKTVWPDGVSISISSEMQLHSSTRAVTLAVLSLDETRDEQGLSLNALVSQLRTSLAEIPEARESLEERLAMAGYLVRQEYDTPSLKVVDARMYTVNGDFPRILPSMLPAGVTRVRYQLLLAACAPYKIECPFTID